MTTIKIMVFAVWLNGCSWSFQEHASSYSAYHEPHCTDVPGFWLLDGATAVGGLVAAANEVGKPSSGAAATVAATSSVLFFLSAWSGHRWASECERARRDHREQEDIERLNRSKAQPGAPVGAGSAPEHFSCAGAGTLSICTRNFASCNLARDEALSQQDQINMTPCESAERVWCFDREPGAEQCFADRGACLARAAKALPGDATCDERM